MIYVSYPYGEFGYSISRGLWFPYLYKLTGNKVGVKAVFPFPKELTEKWFDDYVCIDRKQLKREMCYNRDLYYTKFTIDHLFLDNKYLLKYPDAPIRRLPLPQFDSPIIKKYVILFPSVYEYIMKKEKWVIQKNRWRHSLCMNEWIKISQYCKDKGYKVVVIYDDGCCGDDNAKEIADKILKVTKSASRTKPNSFFVKQLPWMQHAKINFGLGGAIHIPISFEGMKVMGTDRSINNKFKILIENMTEKDKADMNFTLDPIKYDLSGDIPRVRNRIERCAMWELVYKDVVREHTFVCKYVIQKLNDCL